MIRDLVAAWLLLATCVLIHSMTLTWVSRRVLRTVPSIDAGFWRMTWVLIRIAGHLVLAHLLEVGCFAAFYAREGAFSDARACWYFSIVTYTTVGYGDLVPHEGLRFTAGVEGLTGILMCGWSTGFFFAVVSRFHRLHDAGDR